MNLKTSDPERLVADVIVVGGGVAGLNAAMAAVDRGATVVVVDKGGIARSGNTAGGIDHFCAYLNTDPTWDTREAYLRFVGQSAHGAVNLSVQNSIYCRELTAAIDRMREIGTPLTQPDGTFFRTQSMGQPGPYWVNFNGKRLKPSLASAVRRRGCRVVEKAMACQLLLEGGRVTGVAAFGVRTGQFYVLTGKATVLTTGSTNRLYLNPTGIPFNTINCPADTGAAQSMAYRTGATLGNMEYLKITVVPRGFCAPGLNAYLSLGCYIVNGLGERFMERYHPMSERAPRHYLALGVFAETRAGRGPISLDCRHLSRQKMDHLMTTLGYDKDTLPDFFEQKGLDLTRDLLEITLSDGSTGGPSDMCGAGVVIDETCSSSIPGLFAAGDCTDQSRALHMATTGGWVAGREAATYAVASGHVCQPGPARIADAEARIFAPVRRSDGITPRDFEDAVQRIMWEHVGPERTEASLTAALSKLESLESQASELAARDYHELMRAMEARMLLDVGQIVARSSLYRRESRFTIYHNRSDFPESDDRFLGQTMIRSGVSGPELWTKKLSYEIPMA